MEKLIETAVNQVPGLVVLTVVVQMFLKFLRGCMDMLKIMHKDHLEAREISRQAIESNIKATADNTEAMMRLSASIHETFQKLGKEN